MALVAVTLVAGACSGGAADGTLTATMAAQTTTPVVSGLTASTATTPGTAATSSSTTATDPTDTTDPDDTVDPTNSDDQTDATDPTDTDPTETTAPGTAAGASTESGDGAVAAPDWLGRRPLPTTPDGRVEVPQTTPAELGPRLLVTADRFPPPPSEGFASSIGPVDDTVLARSTWQPGCPVEPEDLAHVTVAFWGFDDQHHTGELLVAKDVARDLVWVFEQLHGARFPIEEMRITTRAELEAEPTGDGNNTTAFVCRAVTGGSSYSEHAYGLAIDVNPFHNPYKRGDLVLPELAGHYLDRGVDHPGMITGGDVAVEAFAAIGWAWGGNWRSLKDYQHFSHNGR